jgi:hypothetical protein
MCQVELLVRLDALKGPCEIINWHVHSGAYLLEMAVQISCELTEQHPEQVCQKRTSKVKTLLAEVVTIIELAAFESGKEEPVDHVSEEVRLLGLGALGHGNVRKHLLLQNLLRISQTPLT